MTPLFADVVWPSLFLEQRLFSWWAIGLGLVVELFFVRRLTTLNWPRCIAADLLMNAVSALCGLILIPLAGIVWEIFPGMIMYKIFNIGTFNPATWTATYLFAVFINGILETLFLKYVFKQKTGRRVFLWICFANALSVALAFGSLLVRPPRM